VLAVVRLRLGTRGQQGQCHHGGKQQGQSFFIPCPWARARAASL